MSLGAHLDELRSRLIRCIVLVGVAFVAAWIFREQIMQVLFRPHIHTAERMRISPALKIMDYMESVTVQLRACLSVAVTVTVPYLLYQVWAFIAPGLYRNERLFFTRILAASVLCFAAGTLFGYFLFIPLALRFLLSLAPASTEPVLMMGSYLSLLLMMILALGIVFQTPLVIYYLVKWDIVSAATIRSNRKNAIFGAFVFAAFFTPPEPGTQVMMAVPILVLYELGLLVAAPTRASIAGFLRLGGLAALVAGLLFAWYNYWPVARLVDFEGDVRIDDMLVANDRHLRLPRGAAVNVGEGGWAELHFRLRGDGERIALAEETKVTVFRNTRISAERGTVLSDRGRGGRTLSVVVPGGEVRHGRGLAEIRIKEEESFRVTVSEGTLNVLYRGETFEIPAGRMRTFRPEDETAPEDAIRERWGDLYRDR